MSTTKKASVHLGPNYTENLEVCRNTNFEELKTLFDVTQQLIFSQNFQILNVSTIEWTHSPWMRSSLLRPSDQVGESTIVRVYSDSVLCMGKMYEHTEANAKWKDQLPDLNSPTLAESIFELMEN